jgi:hypothetical protein
LLLLAIWFLDEDRLGPFLVAAGAAMICQEQIGLIVACLGIWYGLTKRRPATGLLLAAFGILVTAVDFAVVLRHYSGGSPYLGRYRTAGGSFRGIAANLVTHPLRIARTVQLTDVLAALVLVTPVLGLCLVSTLTLASLPQVALLTLSDNPGDWNYAAQLVLPLVPFVYAGTVFALAREERVGARRRFRFRADHVLVASVAVALTLGTFSPLALLRPRSTALVAAERHAVSLVPAGVAVSATNHLGSHLSARRYVYVFPTIKRANWVVIDTGDDWMPDMAFLHAHRNLAVGRHDLYWQPQLMMRMLRALERSPHWRSVYASRTIHVFTRRPGRPS